MKNRMKLVITILLSINLFCLPINSSYATPTVHALDSVAVTVNNGVVLESEINSMMAAIKANAHQTNQPLPTDELLRTQVIERLIMNSIVLQLAKAEGIQVLDSQLDAAITSVANQNGLSLIELQQLVSANGSYNLYREQFRKDMLIHEIQNSAVRKRISISPHEVDNLAKQIARTQAARYEFNLSHILIAVPENGTMEQIQHKKELANELASDLAKGANFAKLSAEYSDDPKALQGGSMGWSKEEELPPAFVDEIKDRNKGSVIGPIRSRAGYHIIKINDIRTISKPKVMAMQVHARHILIKPTVILTERAAYEKAEQLLAKIKNKTILFEQAARENSDDPGSSQQGGDLGWATPTSFDPGFAEALQKLKVNEISQPVKSSYGWHLIQLLETRQVDATDDSIKDQAYRLLYNRKFAEESQLWLQEQRSMAFVKIMDQ